MSAVIPIQPSWVRTLRGTGSATPSTSRRTAMQQPRYEFLTKLWTTPGPLCIEGEVRLARQRVVGVDDHGLGDDTGHVRVGERRDHRVDLARQPLVVLVGEEDDRSARPRQAALERGDDAEVGRVLDELDARVIVRADDLEGVVRRAVVLDEQLVLGPELGEDRVELTPQVARPVVRGHADGDGRTDALSLVRIRSARLTGRSVRAPPGPCGTDRPRGSASPSVTRGVAQPSSRIRTAPADDAVAYTRGDRCELGLLVALEREHLSDAEPEAESRTG
jgi:hypothetical protein